MLDDEALLARFIVQDSLSGIGTAAMPALVAAIRDARGDALLGALRVARGVPTAAVGAAAGQRAGDGDARVREAVARLLGQTGGPNGIAVLDRMLDDDAAVVRAAAIAALGRLGHWPAAARIAKGLRDSDWQVRRQAALALRALGAVGAVLLRRAARDEDRFARDMATLALDLPDAAVAR